MKGKSKTGGGKLAIKKPTSARQNANLRKNIGRSPQTTNLKKDAPKKDNKKIKQIEEEKLKTPRINFKKRRKRTSIFITKDK